MNRSDPPWQPISDSKKSLPDLTDRIVETYVELGTINHLGHCPLPNYETIIAATEDLKEILYPGYRRRDGLHLGNVTYHVGDLIDRLHDRLTIADRPGALPRRGQEHARATRNSESDFEALGQAKAIAFLEQLPELREDAGHGRRRRPTTATRPASRSTR